MCIRIVMYIIYSKVNMFERKIYFKGAIKWTSFNPSTDFWSNVFLRQKHDSRYHMVLNDSICL